MNLSVKVFSVILVVALAISLWRTTREDIIVPAPSPPSSPAPMSPPLPSPLPEESSSSSSSSSLWWRPTSCMHPPLDRTAPMIAPCLADTSGGRRLVLPKISATFDHCPLLRQARYPHVFKTEPDKYCLIGEAGVFSSASDLLLMTGKQANLCENKKSFSHGDLLSVLYRNTHRHSRSASLNDGSVIITGDSTGRELFFSFVAQLRDQPLTYSFGAHQSLIYQLYSDGTDLLRNLNRDVSKMREQLVDESRLDRRMLLRVIFDFSPYENSFSSELFEWHKSGNKPLVHILMKSFWFLNRGKRNNHGPLQELQAEDEHHVMVDARDYLDKLINEIGRRRGGSSYRLLVPSTLPMRRIVRSFLSQRQITQFNRLLIAKRNKVRRDIIWGVNGGNNDRRPRNHSSSSHFTVSYVPFAETVLEQRGGGDAAEESLIAVSNDAVHFGCKLMHFGPNQYDRNNMQTFGQNFHSNGRNGNGCKDEMNRFMTMMLVKELLLC